MAARAARNVLVHIDRLDLPGRGCVWPRRSQRPLELNKKGSATRRREVETLFACRFGYSGCQPCTNVDTACLFPPAFCNSVTRKMPSPVAMSMPSAVADSIVPAGLLAAFGNATACQTLTGASSPGSIIVAPGKGLKARTRRANCEAGNKKSRGASDFSSLEA